MLNDNEIKNEGFNVESLIESTIGRMGEDGITKYLGKIGGILKTINSSVKEGQFDILNTVKKILIENNISLNRFLPNNIKQKTPIELINKMMNSTTTYFSLIIDNIVFIEDDIYNKDDSDIVKSLKKELARTRLSIELQDFLANLKTTEQKNGLIKLFSYDCDKIINKKISLLNINVSETLQKCKDNGISNNDLNKYLEAIRYILKEIILKECQEIQLEEIIDFYELLRNKSNDEI